MIIWSGKGFLVAIFVVGSALIANALTNAVTGSEAYWDENRWVLGASLLVAAGLSWMVGKALAGKNRRGLGEKETRDELTSGRDYDSLFFLRMQWWGPLLAVVGLAVMASDLLI